MWTFFYIYEYNFLIQIEVSVQRRKNWVKKLEKQLQKKAEDYLGNIMFCLKLFFIANKQYKIRHQIKDTRFKSKADVFNCILLNYLLRFNNVYQIIRINFKS